MPRVLHIVNKWEQGGVERFIEGLILGCHEDEIRQSVLSICTGINSEVACPKYGPLHDGASMPSMLLGAAKLGKFLDEHRFDAVHVHTQNSSGFLYAAVAKRHGVPHRIIHSHNSSLGLGAGVVKQSAQTLFRTLFSGSETMRLACSHEAGEHLFASADYRVVPNGIDIERFRFNAVARSELREAIGASEAEVLVGCVGSFIPVKNHKRALAVFARYQQLNPEAKLLLLGDGELREDLRADVEMRGLDGAVVMPGFVEDAHCFYSAMDVLLFPSLFEGLPISLVEAQCNGLPVVCSDAVTHEVALLDTFLSMPLSADDYIWATALDSGRRDFSGASANAVRAAGFDRESTISALLDIYRGIPDGE